MKKNTTTRDMTQGSIPEHLVAFALPLLAGSILQQLYNMVDSWVVGKHIGDGALAAVGAAYPVTFLIISLFIGVSTGGTVIISQHFGAHKMQEIRDTVNALYAAALCAVIPVTILFIWMLPMILRLLHVEASYYADAYTYLLIVSAGMAGTVGYNINAGILQGLGDSRTPLLFLVISSVLNIVFDLVSVLCLDMGVAGAALSTVIAQLFSWIFGLFYINRKYSQFAFRPLQAKGKWGQLKSVLRVGLPAGLQQAMIAFGMIFCVAKINSFGEAYTAGYNVGNKIDSFAWLFVQSLSVAVTTFVGQNIGAGNYVRAKRGIRTVILMALACCALCMAVILPLRHSLIALFSDTPATIVAGGEYLWFIMWGYPALCVMFCLNSAMRGAGDSMFPLLCSVLSMIVLRLPTIYYIADRFGSQKIYLAYDIGWAVGLVLCVAYYLGGRWKHFGGVTDAIKKETVL